MEPRPNRRSRDSARYEGQRQAVPDRVQEFLVGYEHDGSIWSRWGDWQHGDPRWKVFIHDHTHEQLKTTIETVASCIESTRAGRAPLMKEDEWWL